MGGHFRVDSCCFQHFENIVGAQFRRRRLNVPAHTAVFAGICHFSLGAFVVLVSRICCSVFTECFHFIHLNVFWSC